MLSLKQKNQIEITKDPTPIDLTYTGSEQVLIVAGKAGEGGTMRYGVTLSGEGKPYTYTKGLPKRTDAGTYTIWYFAQGNGSRSQRGTWM